MREDADENTTDSYNSLQGNSCTVFDLSFRMDYFTLVCFLSKVFCQSVSAMLEQERTIVLSCVFFLSSIFDSLASPDF